MRKTTYYGSMAERHKSKRVKFQSGKQRGFLLAVKNKLGINWREFAKILKISEKTLLDWKREKITLPLDTVKTIHKKSGLPIPKNVTLLSPYWYTKKGARKGGLAVLKKYKIIGGNPQLRIKKWREWWEKEGRFKEHPILNKKLPFKKPKKTRELAELIGILLGDGGISRYQIKITLHLKNDLAFSRYVVKLIEDLVGVKPSVHCREDCSVLNIEISRIGLVDYFTSSLGLKVGNKIRQKVNIPQWIMRKKEYRIACLRGLIDTDGTVIIHRYKSRDQFYVFKKLGFTNRSFPLLKSVNNILNELKIKNRITKDQYDVRIEAVADVRRYFDLVGSNNPKHLKRYLSGL
jgi:hypothetical protein